MKNTRRKFTAKFKAQVARMSAKISFKNRSKFSDLASDNGVRMD
jgi:hypothetical protein